MAKPKALEVWHTPDYLSALKDAELTGEVSDETKTKFGLGTPSNPIFPEMYRRPATSAGGTLLAGEMLSTPGIVHVPGGGTHPGLPARANGFCYLNDPVLGILSLKRQGLQRIAYVDLDAHHPDGVVHGFERDTDVLLISVNEQNRWPRTGHLDERGAGEVWNLPVPPGLGDTDFERILDDFICQQLQAFKADAIVLQCGADSLTEDPQSRLALSNRSFLKAVYQIMGLTDRLMVLGGGGYNPWSVGRCWTAIWGRLNGFDLPDCLPNEAREVLSKLSWQKSSRDVMPDQTWITTLVDEPRPGVPNSDVRSRLKSLSERAQSWY